MTTATTPTTRTRRSRTGPSGIRRWLSRPNAVVASTILGILVLVAVLAPWLAPHDPNVQEAPLLLPPNSDHLLGTDEFGRDLFSRLLYGTRVSLGVSTLAVLIGGTLGIVIGLLAGYFGRWFDTLAMRSADVILAYPTILVAIIVVAVFGPGAVMVATALAVVSVPQFARLTRAMVLRERSREYVAATRTIGASTHRILVRHILPNCSGPLLVQAALQLGLAVMLEAALSFLGLGVKPPTSSWGGMLNASRGYLSDAPGYAIFPGLALALLLIGLNLLADAVRDFTDPRARKN